MKIRMRRDYLLGILFFSSLWGVSEAILGGYLYRNNIPFASAPLTVVAFMILTIARCYFPQGGSATFMGSIAMLYKFLNTPFFACHLLAIFFLGLSYDLVFSCSKIKSKAILSLVATYLGYILFAFSITYIFRYHFWIEEGLQKIIRYVGISGTLAALANLMAVPINFKLGQILKNRMMNPFEFKSGLATGSLSLITLALWFLGVVRWF